MHAQRKARKTTFKVEIFHREIERLPNHFDILVGDKGYDSSDLRDWMVSRGAQAVIPSKRNRKVQLDCDLSIYKQHNVVERMFCRFKDWRRVATRYDRNIKTFMATIAIAATVIWWLK